MKLNYIFEGSGNKTIVFIHGLSDSLEYWTKLSSGLSGEYKVLLYDLRGHGKSPFEYFDMDLLVEDLYNLLSMLNISKASLIGLSLGGNIALLFAVKYPDLVDKLVIMSSFSEVDENLKSKFMELKIAVGESFEEFYDVMINYVLPEDIVDKNRDLLELYKKEAAKSANLPAIENGIDAGIDFHVTDKLKSLNHPTLVLAGRQDEITPLELSEIINANIKNSQLIVFEDTKHNLLIGRNIPEILKLISSFI